MNTVAHAMLHLPLLGILLEAQELVMLPPEVVPSDGPRFLKREFSQNEVQNSTE